MIAAELPTANAVPLSAFLNLDVRVCRNCQSAIEDCICDAPASDLVPANERLTRYLQRKHEAHTAEKAAYQKAIEADEVDGFTYPDLEVPAEEMRSRMKLWTNAPLVPNRNEIRRALRLLYTPGSAVELRVLNTPEQTYSGYYNDFEVLVQDAVEIGSRETTPNVYTTLQTLKSELKATNQSTARSTKTTTDGEIESYRWLPLDADPDREPSKVSSTDAEKALAWDVIQVERAFLVEQGIESVLADSGNGYHLLVRIDLPAAKKPIIEALIKAFADKFETKKKDIIGGVVVDRKVFNPARIWKLYGTVARKGPNTPDRPWRMSRLLDAPAGIETRPVSEDKLRSLLVALGGTITESAAAVPSAPGRVTAVMIQEEAARLGISLRYAGACTIGQDTGYKWQMDCVFNPEHKCPDAFLFLSNGHMLFSCSHNSCDDYGTKDFCEKTGGFKFALPPNFTIGGQLPGEAPVQTASLPAVWSDPQPFKSGLSPVSPFKLDFLPAAVRPWVQDVSERMSVPLDFAGICCLVVLAGCVNRRAFVYPKAVDKDWKESLSVSGAVIASSGKTKTPTWKTFLNPLIELEREWQDEYKERAADYQQAMKEWKAAEKEAAKAKKDAENAAKKADKNTPAASSYFAGMGADGVEEDEAGDLPGVGPMPQQPEPCRRLLTNDATPEKFHILSSENAAGLFVYRDELSGWVAELDQDNRAAEREMFLLAMTGNDHFTLDRVERGTVSAILSASLFGGFQPDMFIEVLNNLRNVSDGTLPRFGLLVYPDDAEQPLVDRGVNDAAKQKYRRIVRAFASLRAESVSLNFAPEAQSLFTGWLVLHTKRVNEMPEGGLKSHFAKYKGLLPKLAGLLQLVDIADKDSPSGCHLIDAEHLRSAMGLLRYLESHAVRAYGCIKNPLERAEIALAAHLLKGDLKDGFSVYEVKRKHWTDLSNEGDISDALTTLEEMNWIRVIPRVQGAGRPTNRWESNPRLRSK